MLTMWMIYDHPRDYPGWVVARKFLIGTGDAPEIGDTVIWADDLMTARRMIMEVDPNVGVSLARDFSDHPTVIETWI